MTSATPTEANATAGADRWRPSPLRALERASIPTDLHFVRDHFPVPAIDPASWSAELIGDEQSLELDLDLLRCLPRRGLSVVLECAGHRRAEFEPIPRGIPWGSGAVAEAEWTGASLGSVLTLVGIPPGANEVVLEGADAGPVDGFDGTHRFARSLPLAKALDPDVLLAYEMNGEPIPVARGGPVRAIVPGWYATDSVKWLDRIWFTSDEFDGVFQADDYRLRALGEPGSGRRMTDVPVHALITTPPTTRPDSLPAIYTSAGLPGAGPAALPRCSCASISARGPGRTSAHTGAATRGSAGKPIAGSPPARTRSRAARLTEPGARSPIAPRRTSAAMGTTQFTVSGSGQVTPRARPSPALQTGSRICRPRAIGALASHARGRWFEPSRAHY